MNPKLQQLLDLIQRSLQLGDDDKCAFTNAIKEVEKEIEMISFKLDRTEKVKRTTGILLEETIEELEQKRKAVLAQNKELEIETALERIRARAMAMQHSTELIEVANVMREQLALLGQHQLEAFVINQYTEDSPTHDSWYAFRHNKNIDDQKLVTGIAKQTNDSCELMREVVDGYFSKKGEYLIEVKGEKLKEWYGVLAKTIPEIWEEIKESPYDTNYWYLTDFSGGSMLMVTIEPPSEETKNIQKRCTAVFDMAFRRFLDLKKAEAQMREALIENALEKIRSRSLAMHSSQELKEVVNAVYERIKVLNIDIDSFTIIVAGENEQEIEYWIANADVTTYPSKISVPVNGFFPHETLIAKDFFNNWANYTNFSKTYSYEEKNAHWLSLFKYSGFKEIEEKRKQYLLSTPAYALSIAYTKNSALVFAKYQEKVYSENENNILQRFANVFEQSYIRFLDLQKAEAQAREAQIEASLERVRSRSMAMHKSDELLQAGEILFVEMQKLGIESLTAGFVLIDKEEKNGLNYTPNPGTKKIMRVPVIIPHNETIHLQQVVENWKKGKSIFIVELDEKETIKHQTFIAERSANFPLTVSQLLAISPEKLVLHNFYFKEGYILIVGGAKLTSEQTEIMLRFANVFQQTYTRFLDLQKAEAQARESQIELGLERVRASAMAMQHSNELAELVDTVFKELTRLHFSMNRCQIMIIEPDGKSMRTWMANPEIDKTPNSFLLQLNDHPYFVALINAWKEKQPIWIYNLKGEAKDTMVNYVFTYTEFSKLPEMVKNGMIQTKSIFFNASFNTFGSIQVDTLEPFSIENQEILTRFGNVFDYTYKRFNDLQKAEAQAREAQIEAALERVRSRTMSMQKSDELAETVSILFKQLLGLGINLTQLRTCGIATFNDDEPTGNVFMSDIDGDIISDSFEFRYDEAPSYKKIYAAWKNCEKHTVLHLTDKALVEHFSYIKKYSGVSNFEMAEVGINFTEIYFQALFFSQGYLFIISYEPLTEYHDTFKRFGALFQQTYTRFLDFKKAEAQAREAQIEAALERVRSRSMAMHKSEELADLSFELVKQVHALGVNTWFCAFNITNEEAKNSIEWGSNAEGTYNKYITPRENVFLRYYEAGQRGEILHINEIGLDQCTEHYKYLCSLPGLGEQLNKLKDAGISFPKSQIDHVAYFRYGYILFITFELAPEAHDIFRRFAKVFEQTYIRFLDLQQAEAQAKEAQIEAGLERVRSRTMAMQRSSELTETVKLLFEEFKKFQTEPDMANLSRGFITIVNEEKKCFDLWITDIDGNEIKRYFKIDFAEPTTGTQLYNSWQAHEPNLIVDLSGEKLNHWLDYLTSQGFQVAPGLYGTRRLNNFIYHSKGFIGITSSLPITKESIGLLERFAKVFDLTFTRFVDLQNAEARALLAVREASLDRVRGEIASMRHADDLQRITPLVWRELTALGVPFFRCGVLIVDEQNRQNHFYLTTPDGKSLAVLKLGFEDNSVIKEALTHWQMRKVYTHFWTRAEFLQFAQSLLEQGQIKDQTGFQGGETPPDSITLQFIPFAQGMLYVGSAEALEGEQIESAKTLANAFETAYARYEDFVKLETAKEQIEDTLKDLRATQTQLIQSEKMASLGELTAGIAHEIQNPLNFVNNFSEVSAELIDEMNDEIKKGNFEDAREISEDLKQNLQKITHHGNRARDIVRGMLQHSRTSSGQKEPTDINALCDEYLRLAYHGLRAKDKSFNASFQTRFDDNIGMLAVQPQEMGRVILNLINNAFYAVSERKKNSTDNYEPQVTVSTVKKNNNILISVQDNGAGIPQKVVDKIFQPFFTTKPTGQGTGLGLSLSYDIVKAHGGELRVITNEGQGSEFVLFLSGS